MVRGCRGQLLIMWNEYDTKNILIERLGLCERSGMDVVVNDLNNVYEDIGLDFIQVNSSQVTISVY